MFNLQQFLQTHPFPKKHKLRVISEFMPEPEAVITFCCEPELAEKVKSLDLGIVAGEKNLYELHVSPLYDPADVEDFMLQLEREIECDKDG